MKNLQITQDLVGKYINRHLWSDVMPVGKIVGIKGKTKVLIQPVKASANKTKMEFIAGGFLAHCTNSLDQQYDFTELGDVYEIRLSKTSMNNRSWKIDDHPQKFHDFNF